MARAQLARRLLLLAVALALLNLAVGAARFSHRAFDRPEKSQKTQKSHRSEEGQEGAVKSSTSSKRSEGSRSEEGSPSLSGDAIAADAAAECKHNITVKSLGFEYENSSKRTFLKKLGDWRVLSFNVFRAPVDQIEALKKVHLVKFDYVFHHWGPVLRLMDKQGRCLQLVVEKFKYGITFRPWEDRLEGARGNKGFQLSPIRDLLVKSRITLEELMCDMMAKMGDKFFDYQPLKNNCQHFALAMADILVPGQEFPFMSEQSQADAFANKYPLLEKLPIGAVLKIRNLRLESYMNKRCKNVRKERDANKDKDGDDEGNKNKKKKGKEEEKGDDDADDDDDEGKKSKKL